MRRSGLWLVTMPLAFVGAVSGHAVLNLLAGAPGGRGGEFLVVGGTGSELLPLLASLLAAVIVLGVAARALDVGGASDPKVGALLFALLTPLVFVILEHLEAFLHGGCGASLGTVLEPTFLPGLAIQIPFALAAYLVARGFLRLAEGIRAILVGHQRLVLPRRLVREQRPESVVPIRAGLLGCAHPGRAPPALISSIPH